MKTYLTTVSQRALGYGQMCLADIPQDKMNVSPAGTMNTPAWIVGHVVYTFEGLIGMLGGESQLPAGWEEMFGAPESVDPGDAGPSKDQLLAAMTDAHARLIAIVETADDDILTKPVEDPMLSQLFPRVGDLLASVLTIHAALHFGQLGAWRMAMGMDLPI